MDMKSLRVEGNEDEGFVVNVDDKASDYDDIRQLEAAIREAYVAKELKAQIVEAEAERMASEARERLRNEMFKLAVDEATKIEEEESRRIKCAKIIYGIDLRNVVNNKEKEKLLRFEKEKKEGKIIEEVSKVIEERNEAEKYFDKLEMRDKKLRELRIFREIREINVQKENEIVEEKRKQDLNYVEETDRRIVELKKARKGKELARESVVEIVSKSLLESESKKLEIDSIIADIIAEEKFYEQELKLRFEKDRIKIAKEETIADMKRHKLLIEERKLRNDIIEEEFAVEVMRKLFEDKRIERLTVEAKRRKKIEYRKSLDLIIEERKNRRAQELKKLEQYLRVEKLNNENFQKRVKEMRKILLLKHAGNVAEFIATQALSSEEREIVAKIF